MSIVDELADARTYISDLRHQLGEAHKRHKAMADALAVRADENQRLEYELRKAQEFHHDWEYVKESEALARLDEIDQLHNRIAELEAEREQTRLTLSVVEGKRTFQEKRAEQSEAEAAFQKDLRLTAQNHANSKTKEAARYRAALEEVARQQVLGTAGRSMQVAKLALAAGREPSDDISQWETNGGATPPDDANDDVGPY